MADDQGEQPTPKIELPRKRRVTPVQRDHGTDVPYTPSSFPTGPGREVLASAERPDRLPAPTPRKRGAKDPMRGRRVLAQLTRDGGVLEFEPGDQVVLLIRDDLGETERNGEKVPVTQLVAEELLEVSPGVAWLVLDGVSGALVRKGGAAVQVEVKL